MSKSNQRAARPAEKAAAKSDTTSLLPEASTKPYLWIGLALLVIAVFTRIRLLGIPFERDEAAFAYVGRAIWGSARLYTDVFDNKLPGLYLLYGLFGSLFGFTPTGIHTGALLWHLGALACFFFWIRTWWGPHKAMLCTGLLALYAASGEVLGFAAHASQLCLLPALAGVWALWQGTVNRQSHPILWILFSGLCAGLAIWLKQQAFFYVLFGACFLTWWALRSKGLYHRMLTAGLVSAYLLVAFLPAGASAIWFAAQGRFSDFWFWTVQTSAGQAAQSSGGLFFFNFYFPLVIAQWWWVWLAGVAGFIWLIRQREEPEQRLLAILFPLSMLSTAIGGAFYPHYFVLVLPWLALCATAGLDALVLRYRTMGWVALGLALSWPVLAHSAYWFRENPDAVLRRVYPKAPFADMVQIGAELDKRAAPTDSIAVIGSEPELYLYAHRPAALSHIFIQAVVEPNARHAQFQTQTRNEFLGHRPRFVVFPGAQYEYLKGDPLVQEIVASLQKDYRPIGVVDLYEDHSKVVWNPAPEKAFPETPFWVMVLERK